MKGSSQSKLKELQQKQGDKDEIIMFQQSPQTITLVPSMPITALNSTTSNKKSIYEPDEEPCDPVV